jgi:uncharacterized protein
MLRALSHPQVVAAAVLALVPYLLAAFWPNLVVLVPRLPLKVRILVPCVLAVPYALVSTSLGTFRWAWLALYALLPVGVSLLLYEASQADPEQRGGWRDFLVLLVIGLAVDLRWFEPAWGSLAIFNKVLLLDAGIYGFLGVRQLRRVGFDLRPRRQDFAIGLFALAAYTPIGAGLGLWMGFLHLHWVLPSPWRLLLAWLFTFFFIAVPEELFFRGWMQNLLERRLGQARSLLVTSTLFGLSHFNKRTTSFNWRYVLLAALAGIFYGLAWRQSRRVGSSAITHASVDTIWSTWLR